MPSITAFAKLAALRLDGTRLVAYTRSVKHSDSPTGKAPPKSNTKKSAKVIMSMTSIKDVARAAGVHHSTVSRALHGLPLVNKKTAARIRKIAAEAGFRTSAVARSLATQKTQMIGVVVSNLIDPFHHEIFALSPQGAALRRHVTGPWG